MHRFEARSLHSAPVFAAPDGSSVRVLLRLAGGSMAHFELAPGQVSSAVVHRTVEEIWYVVSGRGQMWRADDEHEEITPLDAGVCLTLPAGTRFQFRAAADACLGVVGITMPPWPGPEEAQQVAGRWAAVGPA